MPSARSQNEFWDAEHDRKLLKMAVSSTSMCAAKTNYKNLLKRYAAYAPNYDRKWGRYSAATLSKALEAIPIDEASSLLDVACGTGLLADMLRRQRPQLSITGIDISPQMLEKATQRIPPVPGKVTWALGTAEQLPVASAQFDVLTCTNAFHLVQDTPKALAEFHRALRPGGTLVLVDWCRDFFFMKFCDALLHIIDRQRRQIRLLNELTQAVSASGFAIESQERFRAGRWGMMCVVARSPRLPAIRDFSAVRQPSMARELSQR